MKATKSAASYRDTPRGEECCEDCTMWRPPASCTSVDGQIKRKGWCAYFKKAKGKVNS